MPEPELPDGDWDATVAMPIERAQQPLRGRARRKALAGRDTPLRGGSQAKLQPAGSSERRVASSSTQSHSLATLAVLVIDAARPSDAAAWLLSSAPLHVAPLVCDASLHGCSPTGEGGRARASIQPVLGTALKAGTPASAPLPAVARASTDV